MQLDAGLPGQEATALLGPELSWHPLLAGELAERALDRVERIATDLAQELRSSPSSLASDASLNSGLAGLCLFFDYLDRALPERGHGDRAVECLDLAIDAVRANHSLAGLFSGFPGVAWTIEHLRERLVDSAEDPGEPTAAALREHLGRSPWRQGVDLTGGLTGLGVYALERMPFPHGMECLERAVTRLGEAAEPWPLGGLTWRNRPEGLPAYLRPRCPEGEFNLGVAHGVPGVIALLGRASAAGVEPARPLLDRAVDWLLAQRLPAGQSSTFPYRIAAGLEPEGARLAWCYGDPAVACALLVAARSVGEAAWEQAALETARHAAVRPLATSGVVDAGLCHGSAGVAHLFNRLFQATGDPLLREAAVSWFERALDFARPDQGIGGYLAYLPGDERPQWEADPGLLTGAAGVGLALLSAATAVEPAWDRLLLASPLVGARRL